ncbi:hypothetical protein [Glycomyces albidus]|uniref:Uncharacterized protein n=1 Tax=Glycomyces albidus TaxID=2656774 RepID=A0A6L5GD06_9ACTN|nr:hypothetical protein [Glycomyces albidus]MQM27565.1 hypothetical protein [Glycomyces albidus]
MRRSALPLLVVPLVLTACSAEEPVEVTDEDIVAIERSIVNISALGWELIQAESRVGSQCMQDQGFTVHDPIALFGNGIPHRFEGFHSPYSRIPTVEQAERFAFGEWVHQTESDAAVEMRADPDFLAINAEDDGWWDPAFDREREEFDAQGEEYAAAWSEAWKGTERYEYDQAFQEAMETAEDPTEVDLGEQPPFGGCELETIEIVYGGPESWESDDGQTNWTRPGREESPLTAIGDGEIYGLMAPEYAEEEQAFLDCLADRGYGAWEFDDHGYLPTGDYILKNLYGDTTEAYEGGELVEVAELPDDFDASDPVAAEFAIALDFAECAEDGGLHDGSEEMFARLSVEQLIGSEAEIYAHEQELKGLIENAQEYIEGE